MISDVPNIESIWAVALGLLVIVMAYGVSSAYRTGQQGKVGRNRDKKH